jgi:hypothetical protein
VGEIRRFSRPGVSTGDKEFRRIFFPKKNPPDLLVSCLNPPELDTDLERR